MSRRKTQPDDQTRRELILRFVALADELDDLYDAVLTARKAGALTSAEERDTLEMIDGCKTEIEEARPRLAGPASE